MAEATITPQPSIAGRGLRPASVRYRTPAPAPGFLGEGHTAVTVVQPDGAYDLDPFVLLMDDRLELDGMQQIGEPHPHAGLETVTFVIAGSAHDRDEGDSVRATCSG